MQLLNLKKEKKKRSNLDVDAGLLSAAGTLNALSQVEGTHAFFQADVQYKALGGEHTPH